MAYMDQARKKVIAEAVKPILKKYGVKGTLAVRNHSCVVLKITSGAVDFIGDMTEHNYNGTPRDKDELRSRYHLTVNPFWYAEHFTGTAKLFLDELIPALKSANWYDRSDISTDYFDTAYYYDVNVGSWSHPYTLAA